MAGSRTLAFRTLAVAGLLVYAAAASAPTRAAESVAAPVTFSKDVAPDLPGQCQECHQPNSIAPMSLITYQDARPWARAIKERVVARQMPPWHIDPSVGVQHFKNDMSLSDAQIDTIVKWVDAGAPQGDPKDMPPPKPLVTDNEWQGVKDGFGPPDLVIRSSEYTMPARHQDVWYRPMSDVPLTEPRWAKMVEIRPTTMKGRRIVHHSIAYLVLNNDPEAVNTGTANGGVRDFSDLVNRRPQLMEWADRQGLRPRSARARASCSCPARRSRGISTCTRSGKRSRRVRDRHLAVSERGRSRRSAAIWWAFTGLRQREFVDIPPNSIATTDGFTVLKENTLITNFQPHFHLRGKAMQVEAILPDGSNQIVSYVGSSTSTG
jgi:hypothetical protein